MKPPIFSFVLAIYNTADYLTICLDSLVNQTLSSDYYEIILVNDCSTDSSLDIINKYTESYPHIKLYNKAQNEGTFWARIDGFRIASGHYLVIVDPDDWISFNMLENLLDIVNHTPADIIEIGHIAEGTDNPYPVHEEHPGYYDIRVLLERFTSRKTISALWQRIYSRKTIQQCLIITDRFFNREAYKGLCVEDEFLFPILLNSAGTYYLSTDCPYHYRTFRNGSSMSNVSTNPKKKLHHAALTVKAAAKILTIYGFNNKMSAHYFFMQTNNLFYYLGQILEQKEWSELSDFNTALQTHENNFRLFYKNMCSGKFNFKYKQIARYIHLIIKANLFAKR